MGPYIPPRVKQDWEVIGPPLSVRVREVVRRLEAGTYDWRTRDEMHGGQWTTENYFTAAYIRCTGPHGEGGCRWRSRGTPGRDNPEHMRQWNLHRAERAIAEGIV